MLSLSVVAQKVKRKVVLLSENVCPNCMTRSDALRHFEEEGRAFLFICRKPNFTLKIVFTQQFHAVSPDAMTSTLGGLSVMKHLRLDFFRYIGRIVY